MQVAVDIVRLCVFCGTSLDPTAVECPVCGKCVVRTRSASDWHALTPKTHFALLWVCSFGLYIFLWVYRTWRFLREEAHANVRPLLRTLGIWVPGLGLFWTYQLLRESVEFTGGSARQANVVFGVVCVGSTLRYLSSGHWAFAALILEVGIGTAVWTVQRRINGYYTGQYRLTTARMPVHGWIICGLGGMVWLILLISQIVRVA